MGSVGGLDEPENVAAGARRQNTKAPRPVYMGLYYERDGKSR